MSEAYIVEAVRTAGGRRGGKLAGWHPADLGAQVVNALVDRTGIDPAAIEDVVLGCVTQAGEQAFALARNVVLASKLPDSVPAVTIDRQCGSSQQAIHFAAQAVMSETQDIVVAAGVESMTRVPMFSNMTLHQKEGLGDGPSSASILARYGVKGFSQFIGAQKMADKYGFSREDRGGILMIRRRISPPRTRSSCHPIACRCHAGTKARPGTSVENDFSTKAWKFRRRKARRTRASKSMLSVRIRFRAYRFGCGPREIREVAAKDFDVFGRYRLPLSAGLGALAVALRQLKQQPKGGCAPRDASLAARSRIASSRGMRRVRRFSVTVTFCPTILRTMSESDLTPRGRPRGLPLCPGWNRLYFGGCR
jgi:hypothetical protein